MEELLPDPSLQQDTQMTKTDRHFYSLPVATIGGPPTAITIPTKSVLVSTVPEATTLDFTPKPTLSLPLFKPLPLGGGAFLIEK